MQETLYQDAGQDALYQTETISHSGCKIRVEDKRMQETLYDSGCKRYLRSSIYQTADAGAITLYQTGCKTRRMQETISDSGCKSLYTADARQRM